MRRLSPGLSLALLLSAQAAPAAEEAEVLLARFRQALLEQSLDGNVSVISQAYVDAGGQLVESAYFRSDAVVNGVRVLAYLQDEEAVPPVDPATLPAAFRTLLGAACEEQAVPHILRSLGYRLELKAPGLPELAQRGEEQVKAILEGTLHRSGRWRVHPLLRQSYQGAYDEALRGGQRSVPVDYELDLVIEQLDGQALAPGLRPRFVALGRTLRRQAQLLVQSNPVQEVAPHVQDSPVLLRLLVRLRRAADAAGGMEYVDYLELPGGGRQLVRQDRQQALVDGVAASLQRWQERLPAERPCTESILPLHAGEGGIRVLHAGRDNGVQPGQRFLLLDSSLMHEGALNTGWNSGIAIGEVAWLESGRTGIRIVTAPGSEPERLHYALPF